MAATRVVQHVRAPRAAVYRALLDPQAVAKWMVPPGMTSEVHRFEPRAGGAFRVSLTYLSDAEPGKTSAHTDTYHGRFLELVPDELVEEALEFETDDPALRGEMRITFRLTGMDDGTEVIAVHDQLPPGLSREDNELGWKLSLGQLAALVESSVGRRG